MLKRVEKNIPGEQNMCGGLDLECGELFKGVKKYFALYMRTNDTRSEKQLGSGHISS